MNFFKGVKQKLSSVGDDISKSLSFRSPRKDGKQITIDDCSFLGGAQLLEKYQNDWSSLHDGNESVAKTAHRIDATIGILHTFVNQRHAQYSRMSNLVSNDLPRLEADLDTICATLASVSVSVERTVLALAELEDQIELYELKRTETAASAAWQVACRRSASELEAARVKRAQDHAHRMARSERDRQISLRERADTFEEEFQRDVQYFREHGKVERTMSHTSATEDVLATIEVSDELDKVALNDFLNEETTSEALVNRPETDSSASHSTADSPDAAEEALKAAVEKKQVDTEEKASVKVSEDEDEEKPKVEEEKEEKPKVEEEKEEKPKLKETEEAGVATSTTEPPGPD